MPKARCPECNTVSRCFCRDVSIFFRYIDEYTFICDNKECNYRKDRIERGGLVIGESHPTKCPFCGKPYNQHLRPPSLDGKKKSKKKEKTIETIVRELLDPISHFQ